MNRKIELPDAPEPTQLKKRASAFRQNSSNPEMDFDSLYIWICESLPSYLWTKCKWKEIFKKKGIEWQKFQKILSKTNIINWLRGERSWEDLLQEIVKIIESRDLERLMLEK